MSGALISYKNIADLVPMTTPPSVPTDPGYPITNLQTRQLAKGARITGTISGIVDLYIELDLTGLVAAYPMADPYFDFIGVFGLNALTGAAGNLGLYTSPDGSTWTFVGDVSYTDDGVPNAPGTLIMALSTPITANHIRITARWKVAASGAATGHCGRAWVGRSIRFPRGVDSQWILGVDDPGSLDVSAGRQWYESPRPRTRRLTVSCAALTTDLAFGFSDGDSTASNLPSVQDLQMTAGATGEVIIVPRSSSGLWLRRAAVYGHLDRVPTIRHRSGPYFETDMTVIEER